MCMLCRNLYSVASNITDEEGTELLTCSIARACDLDFATDEDVRGTYRRLAALKGRVGATEFELREKAMGFTFKEHALLNDRSLDDIMQPVSAYCHDWMHAILVTGVLNTVVYRLFEDVRLAGFKEVWEHVTRYVLQWQWPGRLSQSTELAECFDKKRAGSSRKAKTWKASASHGLSLYALLALFICRVLLRDGADSKCYLGCVAYLALADLLDHLVSVPLGIVDPQMLAKAVDEFLTACVAAGWEQYMHSKFHWLVHLPKHLAHFGALYTCFVHERKHKMAKRYADHICNTRSYEKSMLGEVLSHHLAELRGECLQFTVALMKPKRAKAPLVTLLQQMLAPTPVDAAHCFCSTQARIHPAGACCRGDVILVKSVVGASTFMAAHVWIHTSVDDVCMTLCNVLRPLPGESEQRWEAVDGNVVLVDTLDILAVCIHTDIRAGNIRIIVPWHLKRYAVADR